MQIQPCQQAEMLLQEQGPTHGSGQNRLYSANLGSRLCPKRVQVLGFGSLWGSVSCRGAGL